MKKGIEISIPYYIGKLLPGMADLVISRTLEEEKNNDCTR